MSDIWKAPDDQPKLPPFFTRGVIKVIVAAALTGALLGAAWGMLLGYARQTYYAASGEVLVEQGDYGRTPEGRERWEERLTELEKKVETFNYFAPAKEDEWIHCHFDRGTGIFSVEIVSVTRSLTSEGVRRILGSVEFGAERNPGVTQEEMRALDEAVEKLKDDSLMFQEQRLRRIESASGLTAEQRKAIADSPELTKRFEQWQADGAKVESMKEALRQKVDKTGDGIVAVAKLIREPGEPREVEKPSMAPAVAARSAVAAACLAALALLVMWVRYWQQHRRRPEAAGGPERAEY